jgi:inner membrane protein
LGLRTLRFVGFFLPFSSLVSHLLGDAITPAGIRPLSPVSTYRISMNLVRSGETVPNYLLLGLGIVVISMVGW